MKYNRTGINDVVDNSGGTVSDTLAALAVIDALTDNSGGTANATIEAVPAVGGSGATTAQETAIANNFADLASKVNSLRTNDAATRDALASLAKKLNDALGAFDK